MCFHGAPVYIAIDIVKPIHCVADPAVGSEIFDSDQPFFKKSKKS